MAPKNYILDPKSLTLTDAVESHLEIDISQCRGLNSNPQGWYVLCWEFWPSCFSREELKQRKPKELLIELKTKPCCLLEGPEVYAMEALGDQLGIK